MKSILVGTGNRHKLLEIRECLAPLGLEFLSTADLATPLPPPEENGATFEENAESKALAYARRTGLWTLADDSGLVVDALEGRPGVHSARFAGDHATDAENNARLLKELLFVPQEARGAAYVSVIVLSSPERPLIEVRGTCKGVILESPRGSGGFGYDPLFWFPELSLTFAELDREQKARVSHRGEALRQFSHKLTALLAAERADESAS